MNKDNYNEKDESNMGYFSDQEKNNLQKKTQFYIDKQKRLKQIEEHKLKEEKILYDEKIKMDEKKNKLEEREKARIESLEKKRIVKVKENEKMRETHKVRYRLEKEKVADRIQRENELLQEKQNRNTRKRDYLEKLRKMVFKKKGDDLNKKFEDIQKYFSIEKQKEEKKNNELEKKMNDLELHKKIIERNRERDLQAKLEELKKKDQKTVVRREIKVKNDNVKRESISMKLNEINEKVKDLKEKNERDLMFRSERNSLKRNDTLLNVKRIENVKEFNLMTQKQDIDEKYKKFMEFKEHKSTVNSQKRNLSVETSMKRSSFLNKFTTMELEDMVSLEVKLKLIL